MTIFYELRDGESFDEEPGPEWWFVECLCENKPDDPDGIDPCHGCQGWGEECGSVWKAKSMSEVPIIYLFCRPISARPGSDVEAIAVDASGRRLAGHLSSSPSWAAHDLRRQYNLDKYAAAFPDGCSLVWVDNPSGHPATRSWLELE